MALRRKSIPPHQAVANDDAFKKELEIFRTESLTALQFFYGYLAIHATASSNEKVYRSLNTAPLFWNTVLGGLQTASIIALGRVFDQTSAHSIWTLLRMARENRHLFSKASLAKRKQENATQAPAWLGDYLRRAYVPTIADFRRLHGYASRHGKIYEQKYKPLRHKIFAHREFSDETQIASLFATTTIREQQKMLVFLVSLHDALWQLFINGRKPALQRHRLSVARMLSTNSPAAQNSEVHVRLAQEAKEYLENSCKNL